MGTRDTGASRWDGLDGVRALAVILVLATHFGLHAMQGQIGVDLFFVLSGFLITALLLREYDRTDKVVLTNFWKRRALRLFPALGCTIAFALVVSLATTPALRRATVAHIPYVLGYVGNWVIVFGPAHTAGLLSHTWSLAIEEQFYLLWPLIAVTMLCRVRNRRRAAQVVGAFAVVDAVYFTFALKHWAPGRAIFGTDTHAFGLLAGAALALWIQQSDAIVKPQAGVRRRLPVAGAISAVLIVLFAFFCGDQLDIVIVPASAAATVLVASLVLTPAGALGSVFAWSPMQWIGRRSYGIYLYHYPLALAFVEGHHLKGARLVAVVCACIAASLLLAAASFRWVETPFLRKKDRLYGGTRSGITVGSLQLQPVSDGSIGDNTAAKTAWSPGGGLDQPWSNAQERAAKSRLRQVSP